MQIDLNTLDHVNVTSRDQTVKLDLGKLSQDILRNLFVYGVTQKISDAASGAAKDAVGGKFGDTYNVADAKAWLETDQGKAATAASALRLMQKAVDALNDGKWAIRQAGGTVTRHTEETQVAIDLAKEELIVRFKAACAKLNVKGTVENFATKLGASVAKFFEQTKGKEPKWIWNDTTLIMFIKAQAETQGRDYREEAREEIARRAERLAEVTSETGADLDDLFADL